MPEGPEIRRAADLLQKAVGGQIIQNAFFAFPELKKYERALVGHRIEHISCHGKAMLTQFDNGMTLYSHNQLYGVWKVAQAGKDIKTNRSLRVGLHSAKKSILLFSASDIAMWKTSKLNEHPFLSKLGPDILDDSLTPEMVTGLLASPRFERRSLTSLLLDQVFLAGMGNYLRSEVLFEARLLPNKKPCDLSSSQRQDLAYALLNVPRRSYKTRGIKRARGMKEDYLTDTPDGFHFKVFDRAGLPCYECGELIRREELGGRRLYWCRNCQH
jgi:endonuclease VIII